MPTISILDIRAGALCVRPAGRPAGGRTGDFVKSAATSWPTDRPADYSCPQRCSSRPPRCGRPLWRSVGGTTTSSAPLQRAIGTIKRLECAASTKAHSATRTHRRRDDTLEWFFGGHCGRRNFGTARPGVVKPGRAGRSDWPRLVSLRPCGHAFLYGFTR
jgi:hypothetical protein